jgi:CDP-glucose 4,6-dehydratase
MFNGVFSGKRVWLSGHTGFKGSWLSEWLLGLGAEVTGFALPPDTSHSLFEQLDLSRRLTHQIGDIRDADIVQESISRAKPDFIFHLAAQPLVRRSYLKPIETFETNVNGTLHVLEALRLLNQPCTALFITSDKCYENKEHGLPYREEDHLGGRDPYSSSKAMAEIAVAAYRQSYFSRTDCCIRIASARAGNVIGGGDWAEDRIMPDSIRALESKASIQVRNPSATRPWQHVLEPLSGYLWYAARLSLEASTERALNFGPTLDSNRSVRNLVVEILKHWPGDWIDGSNPSSVHEAKLLSLCIDRADQTLGWRPVWDFETTLARTVEWYRSNHQNPAGGLALVQAQIKSYCNDARAAGLGWTGES